MRELIHNKHTGQIGGTNEEVSTYELGVRVQAAGQVVPLSVEFTEEEAGRLAVWLFEQLPKVEGIPF